MTRQSTLSDVACRHGWAVHFGAARILLLWAVACGGSNNATYAINRRVYDCGEPFGDVVCALNRFSSQYNYTFGRSEGENLRGPNPLGPPYSGSTDVDRLYNLSGQYHQYLLTQFGRNGANGIGGTGDGTNASFLTSYTVIVANANGSTIGAGKCADGEGAYAFTSPGYAGYCAGSTQEDLVAHELSHLMNNRYLDANLTDGVEPAGETGALDESMADFFGEGFERYVTGTNNWLFWFRNGHAARDLANPPSISQAGFPSADRYLSPNFYVGTVDNGGVHFNAGILNKVAYLAVEGGSFNGFEIAGIGFDKIEQIWYRALTMYMEPGETFNQAYDDLIHAATDLYPASDVWEVTKALRAVEMNMSRSFAGDFDNDGDVDASDYVVWRKGLGSLYSQGVYYYWRANFGNGPSSGAELAGVPEPAGLVLIGLATLSGIASWRRRG